MAANIPVAARLLDFQSLNVPNLSRLLLPGLGCLAHSRLFHSARSRPARTTLAMLVQTGGRLLGSLPDAETDISFCFDAMGCHCNWEGYPLLPSLRRLRS